MAAIEYLIEAGKRVCRGLGEVGVSRSPPPGSTSQSIAEVFSKAPRPVMQEAQDTCDAGHGDGANGR